MDQEQLNNLWLTIEKIESHGPQISPDVQVDGLYAVPLYRSATLQTMSVSDLSPAQRFVGHKVQATYVRKRNIAEVEWGPWRYVDGMVS